MKHFLIFLFSISLLFIIGLLLKSKTFLLKSDIPPVQAQISSSFDWTQFQHDAQRTGYNPDTTVKHNFNEVWNKRFSDDNISSTVQPIAVGNRLFIGTNKGNVYALDLSVGSQLWTRQLDGAVTQTMAANTTQVFAATLAGSIYAMDITNGNELWKITTSDSFSSALLLVEEQNSLYLAGRKGTVYAINLSTHQIVWQQSLNYTILQAPSYGDNKIYIGAENLKLYALDANPQSSQRIVWTTTQLYGRSFHEYAPVYASGKVIVNTMPDTYTFSKNDIDLMKQANMDIWNFNNPTPETLDQAQDATVQWLNQNPRSQTFYVFEAATGQRSFTPGVLYAVVNSGVQPLPVFANGNLFQPLHLTGPQWLRGYWANSMGVYWDYAAYGRVDLNTGRIVEKLPRSPSEFTIDETNNRSGAGDILLGARCQGGVGCVVYPDGTQRCSINQTSHYTFGGDLCLSGAAPIYAHNYVVYQAGNMLRVFQGY